MLPWGFSLFNFYNSQIINSAIKAGCRSAIVMYIHYTRGISGITR
jgi:hypothetical protein